MKKKLNTLTLSGMIIGPILGSGIILLPPLIYNLVGDFSIYIWSIILTLGFIFALVFGDLSIKFPGDEGVANAVERAFSKKLKYLTSYYLISAVFVGPVAVYIVGAMFMEPLLGANVTTIALCMIAFILFVLLQPIHFLGTLSLIITSIIAGILTLGSIATLFTHDLTYTDNSEINITLLGKALLLGFWSIVGWEVVGNYSKDVKDPNITIPKAVKISAIIISLIYLLVVSSIQFAGLKHEHMMTQIITPLFGSSSTLIMGILVLLLCLSTVILFVGGVARLIYGLSLEGGGVFSKRLKNGAPINSVIFLCAINAFILSLVHFEFLKTSDIVSLADGFFIANATIALFAAWKLAKNRFIKISSFILILCFVTILLTSHWIVLLIIASLAWKSLR